MGNPARKIGFTQVPRLIVCIMTGVMGVWYWLFLTGPWRGTNEESGFTNRWIMYALYQRGFHPSESMFRLCMSALDVLRAVSGVLIWIGLTLATYLSLKRLPIPCFKTVEGYCTVCGYNLQGNQSGICPECGTPVLIVPDEVPIRLKLLTWALVALAASLLLVNICRPNLAR